MNILSSRLAALIRNGFVLLLSIFVLTVSSCKKESDDSDDSPNETPIPAFTKTYYIRFTANNQKFEVYQPGDNGKYTMYITGGGEIGSEFCSYDYGTNFQDDTPNSESKTATIFFSDFFYQQPCGDVDEFPNLFPIGDYNFVNPDNSNFEKGIHLFARLQDGGSFYDSNAGVADQSNSVCTITESVEVKNPIPFDGVKIRRLKGTFSCKLYNEDNPSEFITINDGEFSVQVESYTDF